MQASIYGEFVARLKAKTETIRIGDPFDPATQLSVQAMNHVTILPDIQTKLELTEQDLEEIAAAAQRTGAGSGPARPAATVAR